MYNLTPQSVGGLVLLVVGLLVAPWLGVKVDYYGYALGFVLMGLSLLLAFRANRSSFYRRNDAGIEEFVSYGGSMRTSMFRIFNQLLLVAGLVIALVSIPLGYMSF